MTSLAPGTSLGPYEIESALGEGGMGVVYAARDTRLGRRVAIKLLPADRTRDENARRRFRNEARTASALDHPNICTIYDIGETAEGLTYLVMALYDGTTVLDLIAREAVPLEQAIDITVQLLTGLGRAHAAGIVHRDIKPANVMLTAEGVVKILDFGVAMLAGTQVTTDATESGVVGTVAYMSPEQATGYTADLRSDLWSAGLVLYEMVAGRRPFRGDNLLALAHAIRTAEPPPLAGRAALLDGVMARALQKDREQRFASAEAFIRELRGLAPESRTDGSPAAPMSSSGRAGPTSSGERRSNLPRQLPSLIGRDPLRARIHSALLDHSLITLAGFGGVGKTRLAQQVGTDMIGAFREGVWFIDLAGLTAESEVLPTIARALGIREHANESLAVTLLATLRERETLLILDNCERVTEMVAPFVEEVTAAAPRVKILATTRSPLGVYGEQVVRVEGLDETAAIALFEERAGVAYAAATERGVVAELCRRLDHLPLAIELAAARVRSLTPREILARVNERVGLLKATDRRAARHQTLEATVSWSYDLLVEQEQRLLDRLSVFVGSFDLAAAERVCGGQGIEAFDVVDLLDRLVDKSLVSALVRRGGTRYRMMDTVREFASRRLGASGDRDAMIDAHVRYFATQAQSLGDRIRGADASGASSALFSDIENLNAAMDRLGEQGRHTEKARLVNTLDLFWQIGAPGAGRLRYEELVAALDQIDTDVRLSTLIEAASFSSTIGFARDATSLLERAEATAAAHALDLPPYFYYVAATVAEMDGRPDDVIALVDAGTARLREGDEFVAISLRSRVLTSIARVSLPAALEHARETLRLAEELGFDLFAAVSHMLIGTVRMLEGGQVEASERELDLAIELAGTAMPQVTIGALVASAAGLRRIDPARSIERAREAVRVEAQTEIMPWFRAIATRIIAWHWAEGERADDAALTLEAMDELERRLGFGGIWWARPIRDDAWEAVRRALPPDRIGDLAARGRALAMTDVRRLLDRRDLLLSR